MKAQQDRRIQRSEAVTYFVHRGMSRTQAEIWYDWFVTYNKREPTYRETYQTTFMVKPY